MAEPTLSLKLNDYLVKTAKFLGWGTGGLVVTSDVAYTTRQQDDLNEIVASGIRQFYYPPKLPQQANPHSWSFLHPVQTLDLLAGHNTVQLPDDFGGFEGIVTVSPTANAVLPWPIRFYNEAQVRFAFTETPNATGPPTMVAEQNLKGTTQVSGSRSQLSVYPTADQAYALNVQYYINPDMLTGTNPYVYGGPEHVETILESCLAIAEQRLDDAMTVHTAKFLQRLEASIGMDMKHKAQTSGYNGDRSDGKHRDMAGRHWWIPAGTYNNQSFT